MTAQNKLEGYRGVEKDVNQMQHDELLALLNTLKPDNPCRQKDELIDAVIAYCTLPGAKAKPDPVELATEKVNVLQALITLLKKVQFLSEANTRDRRIHYWENLHAVLSAPERIRYLPQIASLIDSDIGLQSHAEFAWLLQSCDCDEKVFAVLVETALKDPKRLAMISAWSDYFMVPKQGAALKAANADTYRPVTALKRTKSYSIDATAFIAFQEISKEVLGQAGDVVELVGRVRHIEHVEQWPSGKRVEGPHSRVDAEREADKRDAKEQFIYFAKLATTAPASVVSCMRIVWPTIKLMLAKGDESKVNTWGDALRNFHKQDAALVPAIQRYLYCVRVTMDAATLDYLLLGENHLTPDCYEALTYAQRLAPAGVGIDARRRILEKTAGEGECEIVSTEGKITKFSAIQALSEVLYPLYKAVVHRKYNSGQVVSNKCLGYVGHALTKPEDVPVMQAVCATYGQLEQMEAGALQSFFERVIARFPEAAAFFVQEFNEQGLITLAELEEVTVCLEKTGLDCLPYFAGIRRVQRTQSVSEVAADAEVTQVAQALRNLAKSGANALKCLGEVASYRQGLGREVSRGLGTELCLTLIDDIAGGRDCVAKLMYQYCGTEKEDKKLPFQWQEFHEMLDQRFRSSRAAQAFLTAMTATEVTLARHNAEHAFSLEERSVFLKDLFTNTRYDTHPRILPTILPLWGDILECYNDEQKVVETAQPVRSGIARILGIDWPFAKKTKVNKQKTSVEYMCEHLHICADKIEQKLEGIDDSELKDRVLTNMQLALPNSLQGFGLNQFDYILGIAEQPWCADLLRVYRVWEADNSKRDMIEAALRQFPMLHGVLHLFVAYESDWPAFLRLCDLQAAVVLPKAGEKLMAERYTQDLKDFTAHYPQVAEVTHIPKDLLNDYHVSQWPELLSRLVYSFNKFSTIRDVDKPECCKRLLDWFMERPQRIRVIFEPGEMPTYRQEKAFSLKPSVSKAIANAARLAPLNPDWFQEVLNGMSAY